MPSEKYSFSGSELMFRNGRTATDRRNARESVGRMLAELSCGGDVALRGSNAYIV